MNFCQTTVTTRLAAIARAYQGRYEIAGNRINYWDDAEFTADGEFCDNVLYHGGYIFYRER